MEYLSSNFPMYVNSEADAFHPPLSGEERTLREGQIAFHGCDFDGAKKILQPLAEKAESRYVRISALFHLCYIAFYANRAEEFKQLLAAFNSALSEDFPHKKDMLLFLFRMNHDSGHFKDILEDFHILPNDGYHPSSYDTMAFLSVGTLSDGDPSLFSKIRFDSYELHCLRMEQDGHFYEAQELHYILLEMYQIRSDFEMAEYHLRRGLEIAYEQNLIHRAAINVFYYATLTKKVLQDFPDDFADKVISLGNILHEALARFEKSQHRDSYWGLLNEKEFVYITFAVQGYSNKDVSRTLGVSEKTVSRIYNDIYDRMDVKNKKALVELILRTQYRVM